MLADLHTHSTASDGRLSPAELVQAASQAGITHLSITDHDTVAAYDDLSDSVPDDLQIIPGIELSALWRKTTVHIVGLYIDPYSDAIRSAVAEQTGSRLKRAKVIAARLEKLGFKNTLAGATETANGAVIGRPHFAEYLVTSGQADNQATLFRKYLGAGKTGDVRAHWPEPETVINWITAAGGIAVLAHPGKYKLTNLRLEELVRDFRSAGGTALEVVTGEQDARLTAKLARLALRHSMLASAGSDFHHPGRGWAALGRMTPLPQGCCPVWTAREY